MVTGLVAMLAYAALKTGWALGSRVGVRDEDEWDRVFGALSDFEYWLALWGTVVLAFCGMMLLLVIAGNDRIFLGWAAIRRPVQVLAWFISVALGLYSLVALGATSVSNVREAVGVAPDSPLAFWVYYLTYGSFLVYSLSLFELCWSTRRSIRRRRIQLNG